MPKATVPAQSSKPLTRKFQWVFITIVGILVIGLVAAGLFSILGGTMSSEQNRIQTYLEKKYQEKFTVSNLKTNGGSPGDTGWIDATATPVNNPNVHFTASDDYKGSFDDQYVPSLWAFEDQSTLEHSLQAAYGPHTPTFSLQIITSGALAKTATKSLTLSQALKQDPSHVYYWPTLETKNSNITPQQEADRSMALITSLRSRGLQEIALTSSFSQNGTGYKLNIHASDLKRVTQANQLLSYINKD